MTQAAAPRQDEYLHIATTYEIERAVCCGMQIHVDRIKRLHIEIKSGRKNMQTWTHSRCLIRVCNLRLSPRLFGEPTNRDRGWRIIYDPDIFVWASPYSFQELVDICLLPHGTPTDSSTFCVFLPQSWQIRFQC